MPYVVQRNRARCERDPGDPSKVARLCVVHGASDGLHRPLAVGCNEAFCQQRSVMKSHHPPVASLFWTVIFIYSTYTATAFTDV